MKLLRHGLLMAGYPIAFWLSFLASSHFWHPPAGIRFAFFLFLRPVWWLPLVFVNEGVHWLWNPAQWENNFRGWPWFAAFIFGAALGPSCLRWHGFKGISNPASGAWLIGAMLLSASAESIANLAWPFRDSAGLAETADMPHGLLFLHLLLGDYIGMLIVVPLVLIWARQRPRAAHWKHWRLDIPIALLPSLLLTGVLLTSASGGQTYFFATGLCLIPATYMAFRSGWRGAAVAVTSISLLLASLGWLNGIMPATAESQLFIAVAGSAILVLGIAIDTQRDAQDALRRQNIALEASNRQLDELATQLRETARRNLTLSEDLRRWMASELHDELGQNLTALQMRVKLAESGTGGPEPWTPIREIAANMRRSITGLLTGLRPAGLDEFGLIDTLHNGPLRSMVETAGLRYSIRIDSPSLLPEKLDNDSQTALYRIVQEAATNTLRHACAQRFGVTLRIREADSRLHVVLACADDGKGIAPSPPPRGIGLHGISDRTLSFGGHLRIRSGSGGTRLVVALTLTKHASID